jgi:hypothetical protein
VFYCFLATVGGLYMLFCNFTGRAILKILAVGHAVLAICGFVLLLVFAFGWEMLGTS